MPKLTLALLFAAGALISGCGTAKPNRRSRPRHRPLLRRRRRSQPRPPKPVCPPDSRQPKKKTAKTKAKSKTEVKAARLRTSQTGRLGSNGACRRAGAPAPAPAASCMARYDISGNKPVTDIAQVQSGGAAMVRERDWEGEIRHSGRQHDLHESCASAYRASEPSTLPANRPTKRLHHRQAWIPFYFGSDRARWEMAYKGRGV